MSAITIEKDSIKIPIEMTEKDGWVVLTLSPKATLILRAEKLSEYVPKKLENIIKAARAITEDQPMPSYYHPSKARALRELRELGITNVSGGEEYFSEQITTAPSLEQVRKGLASIKGSLSDFVISERDES